MLCAPTGGVRDIFMDDRSKFHPIRDFAILASLLSAFLYAVGFLYETVYLEGFGLDSSEFSPDIPTSISFGFRYMFLNTTSGIVGASIVAFFALLVIDQVKQDFLLWLEGNERISSWCRGISEKINSNKIKVYFLIASPFLFFVILFHSISEGVELAESLKKEKINESITVEKLGHEVKFEGKVIRLRDGAVAFWDKSNNITYIFNLKSVVSITYGVESPNKSSKNNGEKAAASS